MEEFVRICGVGIIAGIAALVLKKEEHTMATLLTTGACVLAGYFLLEVLAPVIRFLKELQQLSGISDTLMTPLFKTVAVGFLSQITASLCQDAGQTAVAKTVELCGSVLALYLSLPILNTVLSLLRELMGG